MCGSKKLLGLMLTFLGEADVYFFMPHGGGAGVMFLKNDIIFDAELAVWIFCLFYLL